MKIAFCSSLFHLDLKINININQVHFFFQAINIKRELDNRTRLLIFTYLMKNMSDKSA